VSLALCRSLTVALSLVAGASCLREGPVAKAWAGFADSAALSRCQDSLKGRASGRCTVELAGGRFVLLRDSTASTDAFMRSWNASLSDARVAYAQRRTQLESQFGAAHQCQGELVVWPDHGLGVFLKVQGPDHPEVDSIGPVWAVVVGAGPTNDPSGLYERLCSERGAA
jgi:hypothetical protein